MGNRVQDVTERRLTTLFLTIFFSLLLLFSVTGYFVGNLARQELTSLEQEPVANVEVDTDRLSDWDMLQMAIVKTESDFKSEVAGESGKGIFQATSIYVAEVNRILGEEKYTHQDALDPVKSKEMFDVIQSTYNPDSLVAKAIQLHNPTGGEVYKNKVMQNLNFIRRYENVRRVIKQPS